MDKFKSLKNKIVLGKELKELGLSFYKVTNKNMYHYDFQYTIGENVDIHELTENDCSRGGLYFCPLETLGNYYNYGDGYHEVSFSDDEQIFIETDKCKARRIVLSKKKLFVDAPSRIKMFIMIGHHIKYDIHDEMLNNIEFCTMLLNENGNLIQFMSDEIKNNDELCKLALYSNGESIRFMSERICNNKEMCLIAVKNNGYSLRFTSDAIKNDKEVCMIAIKQDNRAFSFMSKAMQQDLELYMQAFLDNEYS